MTDQEKEQAEKDLLELADITTDKQIDDIKKLKCKKKEGKMGEQ